MGYIGTKPADAALTSADIADGVVTAAKLATDSVETAKVKDLNVTVAKLPAAVDISTKTVTLPATVAGLGTGITNAQLAGSITDAKITGLSSSKLSGVVPTTNLGSGTASSSTILYGDQSYKTEPTTDLTGIEDDVALLGFRVASNGSLAKYNLVDQTVDDFQDTSGVDAGSSTNEVRNASSKYYEGETTVTPTVTGGNAITVDGDYTIHKFTSGGTLTTDTAQDYEVLIVGGGGGGGRRHGGGGGAGGLIYIDGYAVTAAAHTVTVGDGGTGSTNSGGAGQTNGLDSVFMNLTSLGGGVGACDGGNHNVDTGGSGGGSDDEPTHGGVAAQPTTSDGHLLSGFGEDGYGTVSGTSNTTGKGGGGAGQVGGAGATIYTGGDGKQYDIIETGTNVYYAGGGGGGQYSGSGGASGAGGQGGGGAGGQTIGTANTGGGGGGNGNDSANGAAGGSGIVILRRPTSDTAAANMTLVSTTTAAQAAPTKGDVVFTYTNGAGSTTLGTDLTAEISADGGSTWTAMTLGSEGSTGSHNIVTSHDVSITSTITSPYNMAYRIKTLNQSASKTTRIQAVSLGWS